MNAIGSFFSTAGFLPHGYCLLWRPDILALHAVSDLVIAAAYFSIPLAIMAFVQRRRDLIAEHRLIAVLFSIFILACGMTHVLGVVILWRPIYAIDGLVKAFTALVSIATAILLWPVIPRLLAIPSPGQLASAVDSLRIEIAAKNQAMEDLRGIRAGLEEEIQRRIGEIKALAERFEIATADSMVTITEQDHELRYTWMHNPRPSAAESMLGRSDAELLEPAAAAIVVPLKRHVIETGERLRTEVAVPIRGDQRHFEMAMTPVGNVGGGFGLLIASVDITHQKREQERQRVIARELAHRAKNVLALVEGIARQSIKAENLPPTAILRFSKRLAALGRAQDLLVASDWRGIELGALVRAQLGPLLPDAPERVRIDGPLAMVSAEVGQYLALGLHELATNATKYGVLAQTEGRLAVSWALDDKGLDGREIALTWTEDGPKIEAPTKRGFGRTLLETVLPRALRGRAEFDIGAHGLIWRISFNQELPYPDLGSL